MFADLRAFVTACFRFVHVKDNVAHFSCEQLGFFFKCRKFAFFILLRFYVFNVFLICQRFLHIFLKKTFIKILPITVESTFETRETKIYSSLLS